MKSMKQKKLEARERMEFCQKREEEQIRREEERVQNIRKEFDDKHPIAFEDCVICAEPYPVDSLNHVATFMCCGKNTCTSCRKSNQIKECPFCRSEFVSIQNDDDRLQETTRLSNMGVDLFQFNLGLAYVNGLYGLKKNNEKAVYWFLRAADQGFRDAQYELGVCYREGEHVTKCIDTARGLFEKAALRHYTRAQTQLARIYLGEDGAAHRDLDKAVFWCTIAASASNEAVESDIDVTFQRAFAQYSLGKIYVTESPYSEMDCSLELAKYWFEKASDCEFAGHVPTCRLCLVEKCKWVKGTSQYCLALTLKEIFKTNYSDTIDIPGPVPFPQVVRLLENAHKNVPERGCFDQAKRLKEGAKLFCSNCGKVPSINVPLKRCLGCNVVHYCDRKCQASHFKLHHKTVCKPGNGSPY